MKHTISELDHALSSWMQGRPHFLHHLFGWITLIGHPAVVVFIATTCCVWTLGINRPSLAQAFIAVILVYLISALMKLILRRPRPKTVYAANMMKTSFSFPSGHAFGSVVVYGLIAYLGSLFLIAPWGWVLAAGLWLLIFLIGISRIYLGAHFVLDVIGGWILSLPALWWIIRTILT